MAEPEASQEREIYEPPAIEVLGTVEEVTRGTVGPGGDLGLLLTA